MFNRVIMVGNLCADPELRYTAQGTPVCNLRLAVNEKVKSGDEYKEEVLFIGVTVWGKQGEACSQYLDKGRQVLVEGKLQERSWESDGQKHSKVEINAVNVKFLGSKADKPDAPPEESDVEPF
ncbi:hypothetical protein LCGC14_1581450 [marine sediment metagenome]|uniref:Single-stranded DNA-binding protein n=1 Tax=marine sediment metagenome TaxID=412755 RepID=A0A0F9IGQ8_9ZZZZ